MCGVVVVGVWEREPPTGQTGASLVQQPIYAKAVPPGPTWCSGGCLHHTDTDKLENSERIVQATGLSVLQNGIISFRTKSSAAGTAPLHFARLQTTT